MRGIGGRFFLAPGTAKIACRAHLTSLLLSETLDDREQPRAVELHEWALHFLEDEADCESIHFCWMCRDLDKLGPMTLRLLEIACERLERYGGHRLPAAIRTAEEADA